jgi:hypothetical protein
VTIEPVKRLQMLRAGKEGDAHQAQQGEWRVPSLAATPPAASARPDTSAVPDSASTPRVW